MHLSAGALSKWAAGTEGLQKVHSPHSAPSLISAKSPLPVAPGFIQSEVCGYSKMMVSVAVPAGTSAPNFTRSSPPQKLAFRQFSSSFSLPPKPAHSTCPIALRLTSRRQNFGAPVQVATADVVGAVDDSNSAAVDENQEKEKLGVVVKLMEKPRLVLKFVWLEKNIGLALDQVIPGHGTIPLSPYYFWPRKDAWEELKTMLESKSWISQKRMIILLNQATDIINLWQQSGGNL